VYKPHLLLAVPIALVAARRWRAVAGVVVGAAGLVGLSCVVFGLAAWRGFLDVAPYARMTLETGLVDPARMASVFAAVRVMGGDVVTAYGAQIPVSVAALAVLWWGAGRRPGGVAEGALMVMAAMLATPFLLSYDLVCLAWPLAWGMGVALRTGWLGWEKVVLLLGYLLPLLFLALGSVGLPVAPLVMMGLLAVAMRRVLLLTV
jgi:hypothetical protein